MILSIAHFFLPFTTSITLAWATVEESVAKDSSSTPSSAHAAGTSSQDIFSRYDSPRSSYASVLIHDYVVGSELLLMGLLDRSK